MKLTETNYLALKSDYSTYLDIAKGIGNNFGGPSLYFHQRALDEIERSFLGKTHIEMIYATLASWGMHRMGDTKTKMVDFNKFENSILTHKNILSDLKTLKMEEVSNSNLPEVIEKLRSICFALKTSESNSRIVGNSKTLAHILPNIVPPIDRQYTIRFFSCEPTSFLNAKEGIKQPPGIKFSEEETCFTYILEKTHNFINHIKVEKQIGLSGTFNTSYPKIFDNLIMAYVRNIGQKKKT